MNKFIESYDYELILIKPDQKIIYNNCNNRFIKMIEQGVVEEVKELKLKKYDLSFPIMKAHGVPEIMNYIKGILSLCCLIRYSFLLIPIPCSPVIVPFNSRALLIKLLLNPLIIL